ncbi:MAG: hypothetical protein HY683_09965 [Chloroflexi bacterium]|nr:hypothetical protein [Chloroflexota bacterium]
MVNLVTKRGAWKVFALVAAVFLGVIGLFVAQSFSGPVRFEHPEQRVPVAHAFALAAQSPTGCTKCHASAITGVSCTTCHAVPPPTIILNGVTVEFPHHKSGAEGPTCNDCHTQSNDIRYIVIPPNVDHVYCETCHALEHD